MTKPINLDPTTNFDSWLTNKPRWQDGVILTLIIGMLFSFMLGSRPLSAPDEGRYTEIPREMALTQDYVTPRLNGIKYFEKPPLMYWLTSACINTFGIQEWALRLWPAILGLFTCLAIYITGTRFYSRLTGFFSALVLATTVLFYAHSRLLILDMGVTCFMTLSLCGYLWAVQARTLRERTLSLIIFFSACAGSILTKGLIGLAIPGSIILLWTALRRNGPALKQAFTPWGIVLFLALTLPWHVLAHYRNPEFLDFYFYHEHFLRYLTPIHGRSQPLWFFVPIVLIGFFPWTSWLISAFKDHWQRLKTDPIAQFLIIWTGFIFVFFSVSNSKLIPYILPTFPPLSLLVGNSLAQCWQSKTLSRSIPLVTGLVSLILTMAIPITLRRQDLWHAVDLQPYSFTIMTITGLSTIVFAILTYVRAVRHIIIATFVLGFTLLPTLNATWPHLDRRSVKSLALAINDMRKDHEPVVAYGRYYQDLPPYINDQVTIVGWQGELEHGIKHDPQQHHVVTKEQFLTMYKTLGKVYIVTRKEFLPELQRTITEPLKIIAETEKDIALSLTP